MPSASSIAVFVAATFVFLVIPGPAVMYVVTRSMTQGRRAGLVSVAGIHTGTLVHVAAAVLGLSAVLAASATAFTVVKLAGAGYLVYLGLRALLSRADDVDEPHLAPRSNRRLYLDGALVNLLNPKTAVFFVAFVPQFVEPNAEHATLQLLVISAVVVVMGLVCDSSWALASGWLGGRLRGRVDIARRTRKASGVVYIALGAVTALTGRHAPA
ncbi:MAG TPA: LysE family translocator [Ilumatobacter sp.]|nr:LysE family translocator [Ilumatobacter sp.]